MCNSLINPDKMRQQYAVSVDVRQPHHKRSLFSFRNQMKGLKYALFLISTTLPPSTSHPHSRSFLASSSFLSRYFPATMMKIARKFMRVNSKHWKYCGCIELNRGNKMQTEKKTPETTFKILDKHYFNNTRSVDVGPLAKTCGKTTVCLIFALLKRSTWPLAFINQNNHLHLTFVSICGWSRRNLLFVCSPQ